jgi:hypothetical protein
MVSPGAGVALLVLLVLVLLVLLVLRLVTSRRTPLRRLHARARPWRHWCRPSTR